MRVRSAIGLGGLLLCLAAPAPAEDEPAGARKAVANRDRLTQRSAQVIAILDGRGERADTFSPSFRKAVPDTQLDRLAETLVRQLGRPTRILRLEPVSAHEARMVLGFERGSARGWMALVPDARGQVSGLRITGIEPSQVAALASLDAVRDAFAQLPGQTGFIVADLAAPVARTALHPDEALGIGSAFKLVVLAELVRSIEAGERDWDDTVLRDDHELPAGDLRALPAGTRMSLRQLAEAMIRTSDNSATDVLIDTLGREKVEAMQARVGFTHAQRNVPFLKTMELFKLKGVAGGALAERYLAASLDAKRALLAGEVARTPGRAVGGLFADGRPVRIDQLEWFASPADLVRAMRWLRDHRASAAGREALRILALNPGPAGDVAGQVRYAGYKGGSEPGVLSMSVMLEDRAGRWFVVSAITNDSAHDVDLAHFQALFTRALKLVADER